MMRCDYKKLSWPVHPLWSGLKQIEHNSHSLPYHVFLYVQYLCILSWIVRGKYLHSRHICYVHSSKCNYVSKWSVEKVTYFLPQVAAARMLIQKA